MSYTVSSIWNSPATTLGTVFVELDTTNDNNFSNKSDEPPSKLLKCCNLLAGIQITCRPAIFKHSRSAERDLGSLSRIGPSMGNLCSQ
jgi:hypothetical protein